MASIERHDAAFEKPPVGRGSCREDHRSNRTNGRQISGFFESDFHGPCRETAIGQGPNEKAGVESRNENRHRPRGRTLLEDGRRPDTPKAAAFNEQKQASRTKIEGKLSPRFHRRGREPKAAPQMRFAPITENLLIPRGKPCLTHRETFSGRRS